MTKTSTATIIPFPAHRARLGLRKKLTLASELIQQAADAGDWGQDDSGVTASFLADQIPPSVELEDMADMEVAQIAIRTSLLALHALHYGSWSDADLLSFFMRLQLAGRTIELSFEQGSDVKKMAI